MRTIRHTATLFYYDGPQVFEARDSIGGHYLAVMVEPNEGQNRYLVVGVSPERLRQFRTGTLDLRSLLTEEGKEEWYLTTAAAGLDEPLTLELQPAILAQSQLLPDEGFVLHDLPAKEEALREARERNNLVLEVAVEPPEAAEEHRIRVPTLAGLLSYWQTIIKHAYGAVLRGLSAQARREIERADADLLDVVIPAAPGSFRIVLAAARTPGLFGQSELGRAMDLVDGLFENVADPEKALAAVKAQRGHLAGAYLRLLRFLGEKKTGLRYSWAEPTFERATSRAVAAAEVGPLVDALSSVSNIGAEPVTLVGALEKADVTSGTWRIASADGKFAGEVRPGGPSLEGLKISSRYRFECMEEIQEVEGTGREQRTLYLVERGPA